MMFFFIPGQIISLLTFPGIIVHEMAHRFFCDITKTKVYAVSYFSLGDPAGFVYHEPVQSTKKHFLIALGPLFINSVLCFAIGFSAAIPTYILETQNSSAVFLLLQWISISIGMHAFPSNTDTKSLMEACDNDKEMGVLFSIFVVCIRGLFKIINFLRFFWIDFIYAIILSIALPKILILITCRSSL